MPRRVPTHLRSRVRERARRRCEYCLISESDVLLPHVPDHIIARKHGGKADEDNLAWACYVCNLLKGSDIASVDLDTGRIVRLFHPRRDKWTRHFRPEGAKIIPRTAVGPVTEYLLQFNGSLNLEMRQALIEAGRYPG